MAWQERAVPVPAFTLTPAQDALACEVREIAASELRPIAAAGEPGRVNRELLRAMGRLGLLARLFPGPVPARGSRTVPMTELCLLWEALATECTAAGAALVLQGAGTYPVLHFGPQEQVRRWLPAVAAGDAVAAFALAEPGVPGEEPVPAVETTAEPDGEGWRLTGEKTWVHNAPDADFYIVLARTEARPGNAGVSAFVVPAIRPGLSGERLPVAGCHPVGSLMFDGVPVTRDDLLGEPGQGHLIAARCAAAFRPSAGAFNLGIARAALDMTIREVAERKPGTGTPAGRHAVMQLLAEMATRTEAARLLVYAAATAWDTDESSPARAAMAQLSAAGAAHWAVDAAMQVHGAASLRYGHPLELLSREVRAARLYQVAPAEHYTVIGDSLAG